MKHPEAFLALGVWLGEYTCLAIALLLLAVLPRAHRHRRRGDPGNRNLTI